MEKLESLYIHGLTPELMDKNILKKHFSKFAEVTHIYLSSKINSCTIHFKTHEGAKNALEKGQILNGVKLIIFWSRPSKTRNISSAKTLIEGRTKELIKKSKQIANIKRSSSKIASNTLSKRETSPEKVKLKSNWTSVNKEVEDELKAMSGIDEIRPVLRPGRSSKSLPPVPTFQESQFPKSSEDATIVSSKADDLLAIMKKPALTAEERYHVLEARDKLLRKKNVKTTDLAKAEKNVGTCPDMCPEKERYHREAQHQIFCYEINHSSSKQSFKMDPYVAIKQYSRSSADQDMPLPHDLRPSSVLRMTMDYMLTNIMNRAENTEENLRDWYFFLWDRTRSIRKDITQQELCDSDTVMLLEQCARFHIFCSECMIDEDIAVFDPKINTENLTKCLQTLKYMYSDMSLKGEVCPNEPEFQAYVLLLNLNDASRILEEQKQQNEIVQQSEEVKFALSVHAAISTNNYVKFFKLVNSTSYLNAGILHRYFNQVRIHALRTICRSYCMGSSKAHFSVATFVKILGFEDENEAIQFCEYYGLQTSENKLYITLAGKTIIDASSMPPAQRRSVLIVASKKKCSIAEVVAGGPVKSARYDTHIPHDSFDSNGVLKTAAYDASDQAQHLQCDLSKTTAQNTVVSELPESKKFNFREIEVHPKKTNFPPEENNSISFMQKQLPRKEITEHLKVPPGKVKQDTTSHQGVPDSQLEKVCNELIFDCVQEMIMECLITVINSETVALEKQNEIMLNEKHRILALEQKSEETYKELIDEIIENIVNRFWREANLSIENVFNEIQMTVLKEEIKTITAETINVERQRCIDDITKRVINRRILYYVTKWRQYAQAKSRRKELAQAFSILMTNLNLEEQAKILNVPGISSEFDLKSQHVLSKKPSPFSECLRMPIMPDIGTISVDQVVEQSLVIRNRDLKQNYSEIFWKVVVSSPDKEESPYYSDPVSDWIETIFCEQPLSDEDLYLLESDVLVKFRKPAKLCDSLGICVQRCVGIPEHTTDQSLYRGSNGILFFWANIHEGVDKACRRLMKLIRSLSASPLVPVAVIVLQKCLPSNSSLNEKWLAEIKEGGALSEFKIFYRESNSKKSLKDKMESALKWLASNCPQEAPVYCNYLPCFFKTCFFDDFWYRVHHTLSDKSVFTMKQLSPNKVIELYNTAVDKITTECLDRNLLQYAVGVPEFEDHLEEFSKSYVKSGLRICPKHWGSSQYCRHLLMVLDSAHLPTITPWPPESYAEMVEILDSYCFKNKLNISMWNINQQLQDYILEYAQKYSQCDVDMDMQIFLTTFPWVQLVQVLVDDKLSHLDYTDPYSLGKKTPIVICVQKKFMTDFETIPWWLTDENLFQIAPEVTKVDEVAVEENQDILLEEVQINDSNEEENINETNEEIINETSKTKNTNPIIEKISILDSKLENASVNQDKMLKYLENEIGKVDTIISKSDHQEYKYMCHNADQKPKQEWLDVSDISGYTDALSSTPLIHSLNETLSVMRYNISATMEEMSSLNCPDWKTTSEETIAQLEWSVHDDILSSVHSVETYKSLLIADKENYIPNQRKRKRDSVSQAIFLAQSVQELSANQDNLMDLLESSINEGSHDLEVITGKRTKCDIMK